MSTADLRRWSAAQAWEWYRARPWPCGFNYVPSNAISYTEMFLPDCTTARLRATKEYGLTVNRQTTQTQCKKMQGEVL